MRPLIFALVIALVAGVLGAYGFRSSRVARPVPIELARAAHAREVEVARALGFEEATSPQTRPLTGSTYGSSNVRLDGVELAAGECVAVVASAHGWGRMSWFRLSRQCPVGWAYEDPNDLSVQQNVQGVVAHVQFCAWEPTFVNLCTSGFSTADGRGGREGATSTVTYQVLRASEEAIGGAARLNRGLVTRPMPVTETPPPQPGPTPTEITPTSPEVAPTSAPIEIAPTGAVDPNRAAPERAEVLAAMRAVASHVRACHPGSPARATARAEIANGGHVLVVSVTGVETETASCVAREVRRLRLAPFQSPSGSFTVSFPFVFP
ncbi:MAG: hypothetical protein MUE69_34020 [Myxococcota bacterium]|nr:hypothetical protein [Myxococcota bacterium]